MSKRLKIALRILNVVFWLLVVPFVLIAVLNIGTIQLMLFGLASGFIMAVVDNAIAG